MGVTPNTAFNRWENGGNAVGYSTLVWTDRQNFRSANESSGNAAVRRFTRENAGDDRRIYGKGLICGWSDQEGSIRH